MIANRFIGIGGCGSNVAEYIQRRHADAFDVLVINTDAESLRRAPLPHGLQIGHANAEGCCGNVRLGEAAAIASSKSIRLALGGAKALFLCAGMGGGTGGGATPAIARIASELGIPTMFFAIMPFEYEGERRTVAEAALAQISSDIRYVELHNSRLMDALGKDVSVNAAFAKVGEWVAGMALAIAAQIAEGHPPRLSHTCPIAGNSRI